ncbi:unnamed protein product, partial [Polarella glacialis]
AAFQLARKIASSGARLVVAVQPQLCDMRLTDEAAGLDRCSRTGTMNVDRHVSKVKQSTAEKKEAATSAETVAAPVIRGPKGPGSKAKRSALFDGVWQEDSAEAAPAEASTSPQPFPPSTGSLRPVRVQPTPSGGLGACAQCGSRGDHCWRLLRLEKTDAPGQDLICARCGDGRDLAKSGDSFACGVCGPQAGL